MDRKLHDDLQRRREAILAGHRGEADEVRPYLDDADPEVRAAALGALARSGAITGVEVRQALEDPSAVVRRRAVELAAAIPGDQAPSLLAALASDDRGLVEVAAWASGERDPAEPGVVDALIDIATGHEDALCREAAVAALGAIGDEAGLDAVIGALDDKPAVRRRATLALAPFEGPRVEEALRQAATDRDWQTRQAAEDLLGRDGRRTEN